MMKRFALLAALLVCGNAVAQAAVSAATGPAPSFEVATIKPVEPGPAAGRYITMVGDNRFVAKNFTLTLLIAAAYDLNPREITGGPGWVDSDKFEIQAVTPGDARPDHDAQMAMLRGLLAERFHLVFHRQAKEFSIFEITVAKGGPLMKETADPKGELKVLSTVYQDRVVMPARNASVSDLARVMQRAIVDRPVVDSTGLTGHYDFNLVWAPDESQFDGAIRVPETDSVPLPRAMEEQLGLVLKATKGPVETMVIDGVGKPEEN